MFRDDLWAVEFALQRVCIDLLNNAVVLKQAGDASGSWELSRIEQELTEFRNKETFGRLRDGLYQ